MYILRLSKATKWCTSNDCFQHTALKTRYNDNLPVPDVGNMPELKPI